jgi:hypothetical protein
MSLNASAIACLKPCVHVFIADFLDSMETLITSGPMRSMRVQIHTRCNSDLKTYNLSRIHHCREHQIWENLYSALQIKNITTYPVPLNRCPALKPLVLNAHLRLLPNTSSSNNSHLSPSACMSCSPRRCLSIPRPAAAFRVSNVCVWMAWLSSARRVESCRTNFSVLGYIKNMHMTGFTEAVGSIIPSTHALLSSVRVRIVSVRPLANIRVSAVSYEAVKNPCVLYQAS